MKAEHGPVDVLVNNAGITRDVMFRKMSRADWDAVIETNLTSLFNVTKQVIDDMVERGWGRIINISSVNGEKGQFGQTNYSAAKAGMHGFTMALAQEVASKGVTVNTVSPGYIATDMVARSGRTCSTRSSPASRSSASARRRTSPRWSPGSPRRNRVSPRGPTSRSTAACTWAEPARRWPRPARVGSAGTSPAGLRQLDSSLRVMPTQQTLPNKEGQTVPDVTFRIRRNNDWATVTTDDLFAGKNVIVFSLPGAFTPTCSSTHLPRYNELAPAFARPASTRSSASRSTIRS